MTAADDQAGRMRCEVRSTMRRSVDDVEIRVGLDSEGQTRVDMISRSRSGVWDLGANARRIRAFLRDLDDELAVGDGISPSMVAETARSAASGDAETHPSDSH